MSKITFEGTDGAYVQMTTRQALIEGLITETRAAELDAADLLAVLFERERCAYPVGHLPGAVSAEERARRLAAENAWVEASE